MGAARIAGTIGVRGKRTESCEKGFEALGKTEGGLFEKTIEKFGNDEGDGKAGKSAEPGAPEGFRGKAVDHVDEAESDAPIDEVDGVGAGTEVLDDGVGKPRAHASEGGGEEDGGKGGETDEKGFAAAMEPHQDAGEEGKRHPATNAGTQVGKGGENAEGEEIPVENKEAFGFQNARNGDGEGGDGQRGHGGYGEEDGPRDADGPGTGEEEQGAQGIEKVELEFQTKSPSRADDVAESEEILEIEEMRGQLGAGGLGKIVGGEKEFSQGGRGHPEKDHGDVWGKKADVTADGEPQGKTRGEVVTGQRERNDKAGDDEKYLDPQVPFPASAVQKRREGFSKKLLERGMVDEMGQDNPKNGHTTEAVDEEKPFPGRGGQGIRRGKKLRHG